MTSETNPTIAMLERRNRINSLANAVDDGREELKRAVGEGLRLEEVCGIYMSMISVARGYNNAIRGSPDYEPIDIRPLADELVALDPSLMGA